MLPTGHSVAIQAFIACQEVVSTLDSVWLQLTDSRYSQEAKSMTVNHSMTVITIGAYPNDRTSIPRIYQLLSVHYRRCGRRHRGGGRVLIGYCKNSCILLRRHVELYNV